MKRDPRVERLKAGSLLFYPLWLILFLVSMAVAYRNGGQIQIYVDLALVFLVFLLLSIVAHFRVRDLISDIVENELLLDSLLNHSGELLGMADENLRFIFTTPPSPMFQGASVLDSVHPDDRAGVQLEMSMLLAGDTSIIVSEHRRQLPGKEGWRWVERRGSLVKWKGRRAALLMYRDITERRAEEEGRIRQQRMEALGTLAGSFAHDINNFMMSVTGWPSLILDGRREIDPEIRTILDEVIAAGRKTSAMCKRLLAFARKQAIEPTVFDLNELVVATMPLIKRLCGDTIEVWMHLSDSVIRVKADAGQLEQVLINLVVNARDAMPEGGLVSIETKLWTINGSESQRLEIPEGVYGRLRVTDNGSGIPQEVLVRIFEPFFTTKSERGGTGLGLSSSYGIVRKHGGTIDVDTEPGRGSRFSVFLPTTEEELRSSTPTSNPRPLKRGNGEHVLLVEDDPEVARITKRMLESLGYIVFHSSNPRSALDIARMTDLDAVVTDLMLPMMRGDELADVLIRRGAIKQGRVLISSSFSYDDLHLHMEGARSHPFIQKPYTTAELGEAMARLMENGHPEEQEGA